MSHAERIHKQYIDSPFTDTFSVLVGGNKGTGKTLLSTTCRKPVLIHSFDKDGTITVKRFVDGKTFLVDNRFEAENPKQPTAWAAWENEINMLAREKYFENIGTFVLDSITTWSDACMYETLKRNGRPGAVPFMQDYLMQMVTIRQAIENLMTLPCDLLCLAHLETIKDELTGKVSAEIVVTGKLKIKLPLLFSEMYVATAKQGAKGVEYSLLTQNTGYYTASSRLGSGGKFEQYEKQDIKHLLKKAGWSTDDKPPLI